jgi:hypothetical protein
MTFPTSVFFRGNAAKENGSGVGPVACSCERNDPRDKPVAFRSTVDSQSCQRTSEIPFGASDGVHGGRGVCTTVAS